MPKGKVDVLRKLAAGAIAWMLAAGATFALASVGSGGGITGEASNARVIVGTPGQKICGASCATATSACAAGSLADIVARTAKSISNPITVEVPPGNYDECVHLDPNHSFTSWVGSGIDVSIVHPSIDLSQCTANGGNACASDVVNGAWNVCAGASTTCEKNLITGFTIRNDGYSSPEAALMLGADAGAATQTVIDFVASGNKIVGNHDGYQQKLSTRSTTNVFGNLIVSGNDGYTKKGASQDFVHNNVILVQSNYVETPDPNGYLGQQTGTPASDSVTEFSELFLEAADLPNGVLDTTGFYVGRKAVLAESADPNTACPNACEGIDLYFEDYDPATNMGHLFSKFGDGSSGDWCTGVNDPNNFITTGCTYTISAVNDPNTAGYRDSDWTVIRADSTGQQNGYWKMTGYHRGSNTVGPTDDLMIFQGNEIIVRANDFGPSLLGNSLTSCSMDVQAFFAGIFQYTSPSGTDIFTDNTILLDIPIDLPPPESDPDGVLDCLYTIGLAIFGGGTVSNSENVVLTGTGILRNAGDNDATEVGIFVGQADPNVASVRVPNFNLDVINSVGSYVGSFTDIVQTSDTLILGDVQSNSVVKTSGTILGWTERCFEVDAPDGSWATTDDNLSINLVDGGAGMQIAFVGCRCIGSCGAANGIFDFSDDAGNNFAAGVTCAEPTGDITWTDVRADVDALLPVSKSPQYDTDTVPTTTTDNIQMCFRYSTSRFAP